MNMGCNKTLNPTNPPYREIQNTLRPSYSNENFVFCEVYDAPDKQIMHLITSNVRPVGDNRNLARLE